MDSVFASADSLFWFGALLERLESEELVIGLRGWVLDLVDEMLFVTQLVSFSAEVVVEVLVPFLEN